MLNANDWSPATLSSVAETQLKPEKNRNPRQLGETLANITSITRNLYTVMHELTTRLIGTRRPEFDDTVRKNIPGSAELDLEPKKYVIIVLIAFIERYF